MSCVSSIQHCVYYTITLFFTCKQDADAHGQGKVVSAYIAMLERNDVSPKRGDFLLRYVAATLDHCDKVLNKALFKDMKGIRYVTSSP